MATNTLLSLGVQSSRFGEIIAGGRQQKKQNQLADLQVQRQGRADQRQEEVLQINKANSERQVEKDTLALIAQQKKDAEVSYLDTVTEYDVMLKNGNHGEVQALAAKRRTDLLAKVEQNPSLAPLVEFNNTVATGLSNAPKDIEQMLAQAQEVSVAQGKREADATNEDDSKIGKVDPDQFTPESVQKFSQSNNFSDLKPTSSDKPDQRTSKIANLVTQGLSQEDAANLTDGIIKIETVPGTGSVRRINQITGEVDELQINTGDKESTPSPSQGKTLFELADKGTGVVSGTLAFLSDTVGQIPGVAIAEQTIDARTRIKTATSDLIRALSINPRFPVGEINRIKEEIQLEPKLFSSSGAMKARMFALDGQLRLRAAQALRDSRDESLPDAIREQQAQNASAVSNFLQTMGVPQTVSVETVSDDGAIDQLSDQDLRRFIRGASDEELRSLTPEVNAKISEKLGG